MLTILSEIPFSVNSVLSAFLFGVWVIYTALISMLIDMIFLRIK